VTDLSFATLMPTYVSRFANCVTSPAHTADLAACLAKIQAGRGQYQQAGHPLGIPWYFIAILHGMECGFNFNTHLHNGDPLTARTVHVPAGRPLAGSPPFPWIASAQDALTFQGFKALTDWSVPRILYRFERYNGMGYQERATPSPYLWSFSNQYTQGKFAADGAWDPNLVSRQCGAAVMLKALGDLSALG